MADQLGNPIGCSGFLGLPGTSAQFEGSFYTLAQGLDCDLLDDAGRGDGNFPAQIFGTSTGIITLTGILNLNGSIMPAVMIGQPGTLTVRFDTGKTEVISVRILSWKDNRDDKTASRWNVSCTCRITDIPTCSGFTGTQPTSSDETFADKVLWSGMQKHVDPNNFTKTATLKLRVYGLTDSDSAEVTKLTSLLTDLATPPIPLLKLRSLDLVQRVSKNVAYFVATYGLNDTKDDEEMSGTTKFFDVQNIGSTARIKVTQSSSTAPSPPTAPTGMKNIGYEPGQYHDNKWGFVFLYATNDSKDLIEIAGTTTEDDPNNIIDSGSITSVTTSSAPPSVPAVPLAVLKYVRTITKKLTSVATNIWRHTFVYAIKDSANEVVYGGSRGSLSPIRRQRTSEAHIVADADTTDLATFLAAQESTYNTSITYAGLSAQYLTPAKKVLINNIDGSSGTLEGTFYTTLRTLRSLGPSAYVSDVRALASAYQQIWLAPKRLWVPMGQFIYRKRFRASTLASVLSLSLQGHMNNATMFGIFPSNTLMFDGPGFIEDWTLEGSNHIVEAGLKFKYDLQSFQDDSQVIVNRWVATDDMTSVARGDFINVNTFFDWDVTYPTASDLSGLI